MAPEGTDPAVPVDSLRVAAKFDTGAEPMTVQTFETVWDAIADTPEQAAYMRLRSDLIIASDSLRDSTAAKFDTGKSPVSLIPRDAQLAEADVLAFGAKKYAAHNWRKGMAWSRLGDAAMRHLLAWLDGEDVDPETGLSHL